MPESAPSNRIPDIAAFRTRTTIVRVLAALRSIVPSHVCLPLFLLLLLSCALCGRVQAAAPIVEDIPEARWQFSGPIGERMAANRDQWLLTAPASNPGMLGMFKQRDRTPKSDLVPWAGEFVGKYLLSAILALRAAPEPDYSRLAATVRGVVDQLIASQADDGYLGPFPASERLLGQWDLWGHYHAMIALLEYNRATGNQASLVACRRAADLVCRIYLDGKRRVVEAGSPEMNMAIIHAMGELHRRTGEARYLAMMKAIEKDWESTGDYFRTGLAAREFFDTPRPRWESLHDLQGLLELDRITGDARYGQSFANLWRSILRWDRRNSGAFSSGEQATGNPYAPSAIETCCSVAWSALSYDMLRTFADPRAADELELTLFNVIAGAQHPSGRWWTYSTPMDGIREASAHSIVFQARAGTPELNCCSVNGPRALAMPVQWGILRRQDAIFINYLGPVKTRWADPSGARYSVAIDTTYPTDGKLDLRLKAPSDNKREWRVRIPGWAASARVTVDGLDLKSVTPGTYCALGITAGEHRVQIELPMPLRAVPGGVEATGKVSIYRGPILLAWDQAFNPQDSTADLPLAAMSLAGAHEAVNSRLSPRDSGRTPFWLLYDLPTPSGKTMTLCDFASAGSSGSHYKSWLAWPSAPPSPVATLLPRNNSELSPDGALFQWSKWARNTKPEVSFNLLVATNAAMTNAFVIKSGMRGERAVLEGTELKSLPIATWCYWKIASSNAFGTTLDDRPPLRFKISTNAVPPTADEKAAFTAPLPEKLVEVTFTNEFAVKAGIWITNQGGINPPTQQTITLLSLDGLSQKALLGFPRFPEDDYTAILTARILQSPTNRIGQLISAWVASMDDPLRLCYDGKQVFARIEAGQGYSTAGSPVELNHWYQFAVIKRGASLELFIDGVRKATASVPGSLSSSAKDLAIGGNPHYTGAEFLALEVADFQFLSRALTASELSAK